MSSDRESPIERLARRRVEPHIGPLRRADVRGTSGMPDYELLQPRNGRGFLEVTSAVDERRARQRSALRSAGSFEVPRPGAWHIYVRPHVDTRRLLDQPGFMEVLMAAEQRPDLMTVDRAPLAVANVMIAAGIEAIRCAPGASGPGHVYLSMGSTGSGAIDGPRLDEWLTAILDRRHVTKRVAKLSRTGADQRHLYLSIDTSSRDGLGIAIALDASQHSGAALYRLPRTEPTPALTDLWVWPDSPGPGLHFERRGGWRVEDDVPWE